MRWSVVVARAGAAGDWGAVFGGGAELKGSTALCEHSHPIKR